MKPLTGWPRKGSVLPEVRVWGRETANFRELMDVWRWRRSGGKPAQRPNEYVIERHNDKAYKSNQAHLEYLYRTGHWNVDLPAEVRHAIQWMYRVPQFTSSGLQIVPMLEEQLEDLEWWLEMQRRWRAEEIPYSVPIELRWFDPDMLG
jgi:hypothetical protein